jgi:hypothetical protein
VPLHKATLPQTVFTDASGDDWIPAGNNADGELVLSCPNPSDPGDQGEGPSYPWTLREVRSQFGPLLAHSAVAA